VPASRGSGARARHCSAARGGRLGSNVDAQDAVALPAPEGRLDAIAQELSAEHRACEAALRSSLAHAIRAGELLHEAKALCTHGAWLPWLAANFEGSERTAQLYMRVATNAPLLAAKGATVADLTLREAAHLLAEPREAPEIETTTARAEAPEAAAGDAGSPPVIPADWARRAADLRARLDAAIHDDSGVDSIRALVAVRREALVLGNELKRSYYHDSAGAGLAAATITATEGGTDMLRALCASEHFSWHALRRWRDLAVAAGGQLDTLVDAYMDACEERDVEATEDDLTRYVYQRMGRAHGSPHAARVMVTELIADWLGLPGQLGPTGWELPDDLALEEWTEAGRRLLAVSKPLLEKDDSHKPHGHQHAAP
jgi:hypothetical protein